MVKQNASQQLLTIFSYIFELLKFAEAKVAGLIALNSGMTIGLLSVFEKVEKLPWIHPMSLLFILLNGASLGCCFMAVFPRRYVKGEAGRASDAQPRLFSTAFLATTTPETLWNLLEPEEPPSQFDRNMAEEIILNAYVASKKYVLFTRALYFLGAALTLLFVYGFAVFTAA